MEGGGPAAARAQPTQTRWSILVFWGGGRRSAPKVVWALDFQFVSTIDGKAIKIASTRRRAHRESLLHLVERSIAAEPVSSASSETVSRRGRRPAEWCCGWTTVRSWFPKRCNGSARTRSDCPTSRRGTPWNNGYIESFNNRLRKECLNRNHWNTLLEARVVIGDFKHEHNHRHRHSALGYRTPAEYAARCSHTHHPVACEIN